MVRPRLFETLCEPLHRLHPLRPPHQKTRGRRTQTAYEPNHLLHGHTNLFSFVKRIARFIGCIGTGFGDVNLPWFPPGCQKYTVEVWIKSAWDAPSAMARVTPPKR